MKPAPALAALLTGLPALLAATAAIPARADTLVDHVNGLTFDAEGRLEHFTGLLVGNDGRVALVLHAGEKRPGHVDYAVDGQQQTLIPGLVIPHAHLMAMALAAITPPQLAGTPLPPPRPEDIDLALATIQPALLARGVTTVTDMGTSIEDWQAYRRAGDEGRLNLRIIAYAGGTSAMALIGGPGPTPWLYDDRLRLSGVLLDAGGDQKVRVGEVQLKNLMSRAALDRFQVAVRIDADPASSVTVQKAIAELSETYKGDRRWRVEAVAARPALPDPFAEMAGALDRLQVLRRYTLDAARNGFGEGRIGRLAVGARADFALIAVDPELASASELRAVRVRETWVGGRKVWSPPGGR